MRRPDSAPWPRTRVRMAAGESRPPTPFAPRINGAGETPSRRRTSVPASWQAVQEASAARFSAARERHSVEDTVDTDPGSSHPPTEARSARTEAAPSVFVEFEAIESPFVLRRIFKMCSRGGFPDTRMVTLDPESTVHLLPQSDPPSIDLSMASPARVARRVPCPDARDTKRRRTMPHSARWPSIRDAVAAIAFRVPASARRPAGMHGRPGPDASVRRHRRRLA